MREKILVGVLSVIFFLATVEVGNVFASDAEGWFERGVAAARAGNYQKAASLYKKACDGECALGCNNLGVLYVKGLGVPLNKIKAYQYWMKAAKQGNANAQYNLDRLCKESPWACK